MFFFTNIYCCFFSGVIMYTHFKIQEQKKPIPTANEDKVPLVESGESTMTTKQ